MNELVFSQGYPGLSFHQIDHLSDRHTGSSEGQQNFNPLSGESARSFSLDASWAGQDSATENTLGWLLQSSSSPASVRTVTSERPIKAQSVELRHSSSQISHHSDMTDRSLSIPDNGLYFNYNTDNLYSESKFIDEIDSSHGSYHNGDAKSSSRRQSHMMPMVTGSSYQPFTSPEEVMLTSPMDPMSQAMFEPGVTHDGISSAMNPLDINDSVWPQWDAMDHPEDSEGSTPYSSDIAWSSATTKNLLNYSPNHTTNSTRYVVIHSVDPDLPHKFFR